MNSEDFEKLAELSDKEYFFFKELRLLLEKWDAELHVRGGRILARITNDDDIDYHYFEMGSCVTENVKIVTRLARARVVLDGA